MMMSPITPPIAPNVIGDALALCRLVENAKEVRERLEQLDSATAAHNATLAELRQKEPDLLKREAASAELEAAHTVREKQLSDRANSIFIRENQLADLNRASLSKLEARSAVLDDREAALLKREQALAEKRNELLGALGD